MYKYCKIVDYTISSWESKGLSNKKISFFLRLINNKPQRLSYGNARMMLKFNGGFLAQDKVANNHGPIVNIYTVYELIPFTTSKQNATLEHGLFGAAKLTKSTDIDKYKYSEYGIGFDSRGTFSHPSGGFGKNVIVFGADMGKSVPSW